MFFNFTVFSIAFILGIAASGESFYSYYENQPYLMAPIFMLCFVAALVAVLPRRSDRGKLWLFPVLFFPIAFSHVFILNNIFCMASVLTAFISIFFHLPKTSMHRSFEFTSDGDVLEIKRVVRRRWSDTFSFSVNVLIFLSIALFALTLIFDFPSKYWQSKAFPIEVDKNTTFEKSAIPGGNVTAALWSGDDAFLVAEFFEVNGEKSPCEEAGMKKGDIVTEIDSMPALTSSFITDSPTGDEIALTVLRTEDGKSYDKLTFKVMPVYSEEDEAYRIGVKYYPSPSLGASIQTLSFAFPETNVFAATAHSSDGALEKAGNISGILLSAKVTGRDEDGLTVDDIGVCGEISLTNEYGSFGKLDNLSGEVIPIAKKSELRRGSATLLSSFEGGDVKSYSVYITGTYRIGGRDVITLLAEDDRIVSFGGVTRGMSGSPIIQNGKIIGALSNMDSGGYSAYATFAEDMTLFCDEVAKEEASTEGVGDDE